MVYPECGSSEDYARVLCHGSEGLVLALNIVCMIVGMGAYVWYSWAEEQEAVLEKLNALRAKGRALLNKFQRRKRATTWESNPIAGSVEMKAMEAAMGSGKEANGKDTYGKDTNGDYTIGKNTICKNAAPMVEQG